MYRDHSTVRLRPATIAVQAGRVAAPGSPLNQPPVFASAFESGGGCGYARRSNPTWEFLEDALGALDGGFAVSFSSGMAAASCLIDTLAPGSRVLLASTAYVEIKRLLHERAGAGRLEVEELDVLDTPRALSRLDGADLLWLDAVSNPSLDVPDLDELLAATRALGVRSLVDATLATPVGLRPIELGADVVLHSATKYIGGHSDLVLGALVARDPRHAAALSDARSDTGGVPGTMEAWLALRGLRTLALRVERGAESAGLLAERLACRPEVRAVRYPGLSSDPAHRAARRLLDGFGAVIAFELRDAAAAEELCGRVKIITHAGSLGGVESLIERQARWHEDARVPAGLLRLSVGCEDAEDLWRDLEAALDAA